MKKTIYVNLKDLAEFNKIDKGLLTDFLLERELIKKENQNYLPTNKGQSLGIHVANGRYGEFLLFDKNMELYGLTKYRKYGSDSKKSAGDAYELFIGKHFENKDYIVKFNGIENGVKDNSIDLIAINKDEILLIQCKNWSLDWVKKNNKYIDQKELKSFLGDVSSFLNNKIVYEKFKIKKIFVISNPILSKDAYAFFKNSTEIEVLIIPFT